MLLRDILDGKDRQVAAVVSVLRSADADAVVLASIDHDRHAHALNALADLIGDYPHRFSAPSNRGLAPDIDRDGDGWPGEAEDAQGHAAFRGQGGLAILSRFPIDRGAVEDFSSHLWRSLPEHTAPDLAAPDQRLSTTAHWTVPLLLPGGDRLTLATWHATPPVFDGPEDMNGRRNHDEAAFWLHWLDGAFGVSPDRFVIAAAANLDVVDGDGRPSALLRLLSHENVTDPEPRSHGGVQAAAAQGGVNDTQNGDPALDTADWSDDPRRPGNLRVDYVLPSSAFAVTASGVLWPTDDTSLRRDVLDASRHRLVWVDLCAKGDADCLAGVSRPKPGE
ncbi:MAG: endonuclease/exonuclease/phosphatase family protein [Pseudomonadota bacterium]